MSGRSVITASANTRGDTEIWEQRPRHRLNICQVLDPQGQALELEQLATFIRYMKSERRLEPFTVVASPKVPASANECWTYAVKPLRFRSGADDGSSPSRLLNPIACLVYSEHGGCCLGDLWLNADVDQLSLPFGTGYFRPASIGRCV